jgi:putative transposase
MAAHKKVARELATIWECPDDLWQQVLVPVLEALDPPRSEGRPRVDARRTLNGIIHQLRSGCQWNHLPKEFGDDASVHRTFQRWMNKGVLTEIWAVLVGHCQGLGDVEWEWQSADGFMGKALKGGTSSVPTPRIVRRTARNAA